MDIVAIDQQVVQGTFKSHPDVVDQADFVVSDEIATADSVHLEAHLEIGCDRAVVNVDVALRSAAAEQHADLEETVGRIETTADNGAVADFLIIATKQSDTILAAIVGRDVLDQDVTDIDTPDALVGRVVDGHIFQGVVAAEGVEALTGTTRGPRVAHTEALAIKRRVVTEDKCIARRPRDVLSQKIVIASERRAADVRLGQKDRSSPSGGCGHGNHSRHQDCSFEVAHFVLLFWTVESVFFRRAAAESPPTFFVIGYSVGNSKIFFRANGGDFCSSVTDGLEACDGAILSAYYEPPRS